MGKTENLRVFAEEIRVATLKEFGFRGFGHVGGALSVIEALAVLYDGVMNIDPQNPGKPDRDQLVISKGHAGPALYATLALKGYFPMEVLETLNRPGTTLPSHCDRTKTPGVDMTTGSLGQGVSTAVGLAIGQKMDENGAQTYLFIGDGECNEGQVWEGVMLAAHRKLDNLTVFLDLNGQQLDGYTQNVQESFDFEKKFTAFGWRAETIDGHDVAAVQQAVERAKAHKGQPSCIVMKTRKGRGCSFAEGQEFNHHIQFKPEEMQKVVADAEAVLAAARAAL